MFNALFPLLSERGIHLVLSALDGGKIGVYVEPMKRDDKEDNAFVTPFRCEGTPEELDAGLPAVLTQWLTSRAAITTSLAQSLAEAEAQAQAASDAAKKKASERTVKKAPATPGKPASSAKAVPAKVIAPSLLDGCGGDVENGVAPGDDTPEEAGDEVPVAAVDGSSSQSIPQQPTTTPPLADGAPQGSGDTSAPVAAPAANGAPQPAPAPVAAAVVVTAPVEQELF